ncbi:protein kinase domain-containing protein [Candidatus Leptofilum sp.]|uniref:protein kinase domain-containing protein n=1 Tax=Candidatus Leptofilum sp. TaxID=3241576 RepID=UPI003B5C9234
METQKDQAKPSNLFDQLLDQYRLEAHITQTAVTDLYRAFDVDEHCPVAVEILLPIYNNKKQYVDQFIEKMNKVSQIKHPNIAEVYQIGTTPNNRPYVSRDLVEGISLRDRLNQLSEQNSPANSIYALQIVRQLAEALELAERLDLFHYHLSPDNIRLKADGTIVLVDLGIPAIENGTAVNAKVNTNTPYTAPERQQGKPLDSRSQIYALGTILHEILTGELPQEPGSVWQTFSQAIRPQNTALEEKRPDLARQTYDLVDRSIRKQPWGRYATIKEFLEAVDNALQNERMLVQTRGETEVVVALPRRSRAVLLLPLVGILVILGIVAILVSSRGETDATPSAQPVAVGIDSTSTATPTPSIPATIAAVANPADTAVAIDPTDRSETIGLINLLSPAEATEFLAGDTANFRWSWSDTLAENQRFAVYLVTDNGRSLLGSVSTPTEDGNYSLQTLLPGSGSNAMSEWHIVLEDLATNREIAASSNRLIAIKPAPITATFTPTPTETATPTFTPSPTPIPQLVIFVSSASLRQGPGTVYPILRFLYEGEVVGVIGQDSPEAEWYNVVLDDGSSGWLYALASRFIEGSTGDNVPIAGTIPPRPTNTPTPTPSNTPTPTFTPTPNPGGGSNPQPTSPPPTFTPPPPPGG